MESVCKHTVIIKIPAENWDELMKKSGGDAETAAFDGVMNLPEAIHGSNLKARVSIKKNQSNQVVITVTIDELEYPEQSGN